MPLRNDSQRYGWISISLHWLVAITVIGLFALGLWMVDLGYYDAWYRKGPDIHRSVGLLLFAVMLLRLLWRVFAPLPDALPTHQRREVLLAHLAHWGLYGLLFVAIVSGYLISSADGSSISVFGWFAIPSVTGHRSGLEDIAGDIHEIAVWGIIVLASLHALAALKHHIFDRDDTLRRMLGLSPRQTP
ncbi:MAG: cytochrome b [Alcanivorax nanhaiticus]